MTTALDAALEYVGQGLAIFPLPWASKEANDWLQYADAPPDSTEAGLLFGREPHNIGIICGRPSGNLLALDCDSPQELAEQYSRLATLGIRPWTIQRPPNGSPHDGGGTLLLRTDAPAANAKKGQADIKGERSYIVGPPSEHPGGGAYAFTDRRGELATVSLRDLAWLELQEAPPMRPKQRIPRKAWRLLQGDTEAIAEYNTRSDAEAAIFASLYQAGYTFAEAAALLSTHPGTGHFAYEVGRGRRQAMHYLRQTWHKVTAWVDAHTSEAQQTAQAIAAWAQDTPWPGRSGPNDRAILLAHCDIVQRSGNEPHHASARDLAELAGISSFRTAAACNARLVDHGLLELAQEATYNLAHKWRLLPPDTLTTCEYLHTLSTTSVRECASIITLMGHDAFRWGALNQTGAEVLAALYALDGQATEAELRTYTGRDRLTVKKRLEDLWPYGIIEPLGDRVWRACVDPEDLEARLDEIARDMGSAGKLARDRVKHQRQRRTHKLMLQLGMIDGTGHRATKPKE